MDLPVCRGEKGGGVMDMERHSKTDGNFGKISRLTKWVPENGTRAAMLCISLLKQRGKKWSPKSSHIAPAGNRTRVCTVAGYYSTTRPLDKENINKNKEDGARSKIYHSYDNAPAGNRTRVCTVAGYYSTTRPLVVAQNEFVVFEVILEDEHDWGYIKNMEFEEFKVRVIDANDFGRRWCHVLDKVY
ncbi:hypothetical protein Godav_027718 [Gossypium davidsonii]|uniref:Uncharacterized protein n=1 Tax=Gossypium davidsonii TaxID=34287 RepID=A0A7J8RWT8_GOSDV|nr:hypothetical protein [Gossypium davidsonii]